MVTVSSDRIRFYQANPSGYHSGAGRQGEPYRQYQSEGKGERSVSIKCTLMSGKRR